MRKCGSCQKEFIPVFKNNRKRFYCSKPCFYNRYGKNKRESNITLILLDVATIIIPIALVAFAIYFITPKVEPRIEEPSCEEIDFILEEIDDEDEKYWKEIKKKKR